MRAAKGDLTAEDIRARLIERIRERFGHPAGETIPIFQAADLLIALLGNLDDCGEYELVTVH